MAAAKVTLHTMLGNYANVAPLKSGALHSDLANFDFAEVKIANNHFKQVVRRGQHHTIAYNAERGVLKPSDLRGKRVGVRAFTVTTGTWVRGILASDYGVDVNSIEWITFEDPHVAEYRDPDIVKRAPAGKELVQMLLGGEIDAAIVGDKLPDPRLKHLIPDPETAAQKWAERHRGVPINHMLVVRTELSKSRPNVVAEIFRLFKESKRAAGLPDRGALDPYRFGVEACRPTLEVIIDFCRQQKLLARPLSVDELFDDTMRALGS